MATKATPIRRISQRRLAMYERYVTKLRLEDPEKLTQFCKLHLSFLLDMDSERFEGLFGEKHGSRSKLGNLLSRRRSLGSNGDRSSIFEKTIIAQPGIDDAVRRLSDFLQGSQNISTEGIFRKTGNISRQKELKDRLIANEPIDFSQGYFTAHDCASVLKSLIGDLYEPLLQEKYFNAHLHTLDISKEDSRMKVVCLLLQMMSSSHYNLAKDLFVLLHKVTVFSEQNLMNADNLGAIFAPHMLCPKKMSSSDLQSLAGQMQSVISFIITHTTQLFIVPELLALDAVNHIKKTNITASSSEESILSLDSIDSCEIRSRKHKLSRSSEDDTEPLDTVVTFTKRLSGYSGANVSQDTEVELAKLYAHVQSMPDSAKKRKLMKQFSEANGYQSQVTTRKKHNRSRSLGESIKRRFSRRGRQKTLNVSGSADQSVISAANTSLVIENTNVIPVACVSFSAEQQPNNPIKLTRRSGPAASSDISLNISTLPGSPYPLHRTSMRNLRYKPDGAESSTPPAVSDHRPSSRTEIDKGSDRPSPEGGEMCEDLDEGFVQPSNAPPAIRKPLLPANLPQTPDNKHLIIKKTREHKNTPPGPKRAISIFDSSIRV